MSDSLPRVFVIGMGEVGRRLAAALETAGVEVVRVTRDSGWDRASADTYGLRLVCVREEALASVLDRLRGVSDVNVVAVQNGWIRPILHEHPDATRGLIWFASKGEFYNPLRPSPFSGPWAEPLATALVAGGLPASAVDADSFDGFEADKMGFNCVVGLPLAVHGLSLGDYLERESIEAEELFTESVTVCAAALACPMDPGWWSAFRRSAEPLGWVSTSRAKALEFRNQAVVQLAQASGREAPVNRRLLEAHAAMG